MSANSEVSHEAGGATGPSGPPPALSTPPTGAPASCRKKKADVDEGFVKDVMNHIDEFVHASYDEHKSCLQKSIKKLFGSTKSVANSTSAASPLPAPVAQEIVIRDRFSRGDGMEMTAGFMSSGTLHDFAKTHDVRAQSFNRRDWPMKCPHDATDECTEHDTGKLYREGYENKEYILEAIALEVRINLESVESKHNAS